MSKQLVDDNQVNTFCVENLNIKGMQKNRKLAISISDSGWNIFLNFLGYKIKWVGKNILEIGRFEPSSKLCTCGTINQNLKLSDRVWTCLNCSKVHDRDNLASNNIKYFAFHKQNLIGFDKAVSA